MFPFTLAHFFVLNSFCFYDSPLKIDTKFSRNSVVVNRKSVIESLPKIPHDFITLSSGKVVPCGTILQRPLKFLPFPDNFLHHEGVVIGTTASQEEIILEMNDNPNNGINRVDLKGFLSPYDLSHLIINYEPSIPIDKSVLLSRAKKYDFHPYILTEFNCVDFAKWLVFAKRICSFKEKQIEKCDDLILFHKAILSDTLDAKQKSKTLKDLDCVIVRKESLRNEIKLLIARL